jgi:hypothetical protein
VQRSSATLACAALAFGLAGVGCSSTPLKAVQIRAAVTSAIWQTQAIASQALLWPLALDVDRDGSRDELAQRSQARLAERLPCATTTLDDTVLSVDFGDLDAATPCSFAGRPLAGRATIEWIDFDAGADRRALVRFDGFRTTAEITLSGEAYFELLGERTISIDAELEVADPDITSAAVGVIVAIFDEDDDTRAELNGVWTWQATAVGWYADLRRAVMDLGQTAPRDGFFEVDGNANKTVMVQFLADGDGTLRAWANAGARDREYVIDDSASVIEE